MLSQSINLFRALSHTISSVRISELVIRTVAKAASSRIVSERHAWGSWTVQSCNTPHVKVL